MNPQLCMPDRHPISCSLTTFRLVAHRRSHHDLNLTFVMVSSRKSSQCGRRACRAHARRHPSRTSVLRSALVQGYTLPAVAANLCSISSALATMFCVQSAGSSICSKLMRAEFTLVSLQAYAPSWKDADIMMFNINITCMESSTNSMFVS